jgi:hypothetical protein
MANTIQVERTHVFAVYQNTAAASVVDVVRIERAHNLAVYQSSAAGLAVDVVRIERAHDYAVYRNSAAGALVDAVRVARAHVFAVYRGQPVFTIVGDELRVAYPLVGTWPVTIRTTDALSSTYSEIFNVVITPGPSIPVTGQLMTVSVGLANKLSVLYTYNATNTSNPSQLFTNSSVPIGPEAADRIIVAYVFQRSSINCQVDAVTVNGVSLTVNPGGRVTSSSGDTGEWTAWWGVVPTGTSVTVTTHVTTAISAGIQLNVYALYGQTSLLDCARTSGSTDTDIDMNNLATVDDGVVLYGGLAANSGSTVLSTATWTGPDAVVTDRNSAVSASNHILMVGHFDVNVSGAGTDDVVIPINQSKSNCGIALSFSPLPYVDSYWVSVVLMLGFDGADGAVATTDESLVNRAITFVGNAQLDTAQSKFGGSSLLLDGNGDRITAADHPDWHFGSGPFTVEAWVRFNVTETGANYLVSQWNSSNDNRAWGIQYFNNGWHFASTTDGTNTTVVTISNSWTQSGGTWFHFACTRDGAGDVRMFIDGTQIGTTQARNVTIFDSNQPLWIGAIVSSTPGNDWDGWMDELRITKGVARYTANFTAPAAAHPRG